MSHLLEQVSTWLVDQHLSGWVAALLLFLTFAEAGLFVGFVLPGETALLLGGVLTATGVLPFWPFVVAAVLAAAAGDSFGYWVGHRFGARVRTSRLGLRVGHRRWEAAGAFLVRNGGRAVFIGRAQALLRALVPFLAGQTHMRYRVFLPWNLLGAVVFGGGVVVLGHVFAHSVAAVEKALGWFGAAVLLALAIGFYVRHRRGVRRTRALAAGTAADAAPRDSTGLS
jgi:membrane-associated protein